MPGRFQTPQNSPDMSNRLSCSAGQCVITCPCERAAVPVVHQLGQNNLRRAADLQAADPLMQLEKLRRFRGRGLYRQPA